MISLGAHCPRLASLNVRGTTVSQRGLAQLSKRWHIFNGYDDFSMPLKSQHSCNTDSVLTRSLSTGKPSCPALVHLNLLDTAVTPHIIVIIDHHCHHHLHHHRHCYAPPLAVHFLNRIDSQWISPIGDSLSTSLSSSPFWPRSFPLLSTRWSPTTPSWGRSNTRALRRWASCQIKSGERMLKWTQQFRARAVLLWWTMPLAKKMNDDEIDYWRWKLHIKIMLITPNMQVLRCFTVMNDALGEWENSNLRRLNFVNCHVTFTLIFTFTFLEGSTLSTAMWVSLSLSEEHQFCQLPRKWASPILLNPYSSYTPLVLIFYT